jgi:hypothetical protein
MSRASLSPLLWSLLAWLVHPLPLCHAPDESAKLALLRQMRRRMDGPPITRRLAAILAADVAGYSRLMATDEEATVRTLDTYRRTIADLVNEHGGGFSGLRATASSQSSAARCRPCEPPWQSNDRCTGITPIFRKPGG